MARPSRSSAADWNSKKSAGMAAFNSKRVVCSARDSVPLADRELDVEGAALADLDFADHLLFPAVGGHGLELDVERLRLHHLVFQLLEEFRGGLVRRLLRSGLEDQRGGEAQAKHGVPP